MLIEFTISFQIAVSEQNPRRPELHEAETPCAALAIALAKQLTPRQSEVDLPVIGLLAQRLS